VPPALNSRGADDRLSPVASAVLTDRPQENVPPPRHAREAILVVAGFTAVFGWMYLRPVLDGSYLIESDLYEYYLPIFLSPITTWSRFEFGGLPAFADPGDFSAYPPHFLFAHLFRSWTALSVSAFVLAASFTYAYVRHITGSRRAAAFAGLAYGLSEALMERLPHSNIMHAAVWLPLLVLAIDHLRSGDSRRWLAVGALGVGCCLLAGHPQPAIYIYYCSGLYALVAGVVTKAPLRYYGRVAAMFALGGLLTLIKSLPFVEASLYMARQEASFGQFAAHANSPAQMLSILFPSIAHEGREAPTYVGLITLTLAIAGAAHAWKRGWRTPFWVAIAIFALLMGMGDQTPVAGWAFYIPLYWKFRAAARHLILAAFALCVLAGLAVAAIERGTMGRRVLISSVLAITLGVAAGAIALLRTPDAFAFEPRAALPFSLPAWNAGVWVQFGVAVATASLAFAGTWAGRRRWWLSGAMVLLLADTLYSLPYGVGWAGLVPITMPAAAAGPSVHATRLAAEIAPRHQRLLAPGGTHRDSVVPAAWARLWQIPIAGGYGPMLLQTQMTLAEMGTNGAVAPSVFGADDVSLDLLAVGRIVMRDDDMAAPPTFEREGLRWSVPALEITAGRADCNQLYPRELALPLPPDTVIAEVAIAAHLRCAEDTPQGTEVAQVSLMDGRTPAFTTTWHAGVEIAERSLAEAAVAARAAHRPVALFDDPDATPNEYLVRMRMPTPTRADHLVIHVPPMHGWVEINRLTIVDAVGTSHPLSTSDVFLGDTQRWKLTGTFATSRTTDRGVDQAVAGETPMSVYENLRALPRAWIAREVIALTPDDLVASIRYGQLPGGRRFDPRDTALVERAASSSDTPPRTYADGERSAVITGEADGRFDVDVTSNGGFLVLSEAAYPGWAARIDGTAVTLERVNLGLQGVEVPAGRHHVTFEFRSVTLRAGRAVSAFALAVCLLLLFPTRRRGAAHSV